MNEQHLDYVPFFFFFFLRECLRELIYCFHTNTVASNYVLNANKEKVENEFHSTVTLSQDSTEVWAFLQNFKYIIET